MAFDPNADTEASELGVKRPNSKVRSFGDFELLGEIARGGMGVVYKARQVSLNRIVAVKMILNGQLARLEDVQRFRTEAQAAANLKHPNIVAVHEVGEFDGQHYFSMDYVEGQNLAELVANRQAGKVDCKQIAGYLKLAAEAIHSAHEHGTLHRDLKPSNILVDRHEQPHITDFGLAKRAKQDSDLTLSGQMLGTPAFSSPEQVTGKRGDVGPRADVYSLGATLFFTLAGRPPFVADTMHDVLSQVANTEAPDVRSINSDVPRDLATICSRCLQKDPQRRYSSALELSRDLDRFMRDEPILARPVGHIEKLWRLCRRYPAACSLTMLLLALLVFAIKTLVDRPLVPHMPILNGTGASGVIRGKLYMVNSADGYSGIKNRLFVYDPGLNTWEPLRAMPIPHGACAYSVLGAKFYLAGGIDWKGKTSGELDVFDPAQNFWATKASMPTPRENCAGAAFNGRFYVTGGASEGEPRATLEVYEALTDTWAIATPMHKPRAGHAAVVVDGKLFVVGGGTGKSGALPEATVEVYDCSKGAWSVATSMPEPRNAAFVVAFNKIIYVAGGAGPAGETGTMQAYNTLTGRWQQLASMPASSYGGAGAQVMNNRIWFLGGWTLAQDTVNKMDVVAHNEVFIYDPARNSWTMSGHH